MESVRLSNNDRRRSWDFSGFFFFFLVFLVLFVCFFSSFFFVAFFIGGVGLFLLEKLSADH